jgi:hypothetical protein
MIQIKNCLRISLCLFVFLIISCKKADVSTANTLDLLTSTKWIDKELVNTDYDLKGKIISVITDTIREGNSHLISLDSSKKAIIRYGCDNNKCTGDIYNGKWELKNNRLIIYINREDLGSLADAIFLEGDVIKISNLELIVETQFNSPTSSISKRIKQLKYISK